MKIPTLTDDAAINISLDTINKKKQALVFANTKNSAEKAAEDISKKIKQETCNDLAEDVLKILSRPTKQCERLARCIKKGIAFHHAGLAQKQRELIEDNFREGRIRIICSTPTLAAGIDMPAFRTILKDLRRFGHRGLQYIPVLEYLQMAGRAGRPKYDKFGESIIISATEAQKLELEERYIFGEPEDIYSKLAVEPVLRTYLLSLIAAKFITTKQQIIDFFRESFFAHQFEDMARIGEIIEKMLALLEEWDFINSSNKDDFVSADEIQDARYTATLLGKRVAELYIDPYTANKIIGSLHRSSSKHVLFGYLQMISYTLEMRPLLRVRVKEQGLIDEAIITYHEELLLEEPSLFDPGYKEFCDSVKTALFFMDWINENDEEFLLEKYNIRPGEIKVKLDLADWLVYCSEEFSKILNLKDNLNALIRLRLRLKNGVKEELLPLLKFRNIGRRRARRLYRNNIKDAGDVKKADLVKLSQILGKAIASNLKKQVGDDVQPVKENKRKGQISLRDY